MQHAVEWDEKAAVGAIESTAAVCHTIEATIPTRALFGGIEAHAGC